MQPSGIGIQLTTPASAQVGQGFTVTIRYFDTGTNINIPNPNVTLTLQARNALTGLPGTGTLAPPFVNMPTAVQTITATYTKVEPTYIRANDPSGAFGTSNSINFTAGPPAQLTVSAATSTLANANLTATATVLDAFGNPVSSQSVLFHIQSIAQGSLGADQTAVTDATGKAAAVFRPSADANGTFTLIASAGGASGQFSGVILGAPTTTVQVASGIGSSFNGILNIHPNTLISLQANTLVGVQTTIYRVDNGLWTTYTAPFTIPAIGQHTLYFQSTDSAGQVEIGVKQLIVFVSAIDSSQLVNFPNPFKAGSEVTHIEYFLNQAQPVDVKIYDFFGRLVWQQSFTENSNGGQAGLNRVDWDGFNGSGVVVGNGGYVCAVHLQGDGTTLKRKIAVVK